MGLSAGLNLPDLHDYVFLVLIVLSYRLVEGLAYPLVVRQGHRLTLCLLLFCRAGVGRGRRVGRRGSLAVDWFPVLRIVLVVKALDGVVVLPIVIVVKALDGGVVLPVVIVVKALDGVTVHVLLCILLVLVQAVGQGLQGLLVCKGFWLLGPRALCLAKQL